MPGKIINTVLGIFFYAFGVIAVNSFFAPLESFPPIIELTLITLGIFFLSATFFGRIGFVTFFFAGAVIGSSLPQNHGYVLLALLPMFVALFGGSLMGKTASQDMAGKKNFFDQKIDFIAYLAIAIILALAVGFAYDYLPAVIF